MRRLPLLLTQDDVNKSTLHLTKPEILATSLTGADLYLLYTNSYKHTQTIISTFTNSYENIHKQLSIHEELLAYTHTQSYHQEHEELSTHKQLSTHTHTAINTLTAINAHTES